MHNLYSRIFMFAGIYNIGAAITFIFGHKCCSSYWNGYSKLLSFMYLALHLFLVFGLGYLIVSNDLNKGYDIVKLGALSKY